MALVGRVLRSRIAQHHGETARFAVENRVVGLGRVVERILVRDQRLQLDAVRPDQAQEPRRARRLVQGRDARGERGLLRGGVHETLGRLVAVRGAVEADDERAEGAPLEAERRDVLDRVLVIFQEEGRRFLLALRRRGRGREPRAQPPDFDERRVLLGAALAVEDADRQPRVSPLPPFRLRLFTADEHCGAQRRVRALVGRARDASDDLGRTQSV